MAWKRHLECRITLPDWDRDPQSLTQGGQWAARTKSRQERRPEFKAVPVKFHGLADTPCAGAALQKDHRSAMPGEETGRGQAAHPRAYDGNVEVLGAHVRPRSPG